jgi:hypothetical protein
MLEDARVIRARVALLIDADNLSGDVIGQAIEHLLHHHGYEIILGDRRAVDVG